MKKLVLALLLARGSYANDIGSVSEEETIRVVGFGDFGYSGGDSGQKAVAAAIARLHKERPFHLGLTFGDNFYPDGVRDTNDPMWRDIWEADYAPLHIPFFATLGNHDYHVNPEAEIEYTKVSPSKTWRMPFHYYTFAAGPVRFFALDTDEGTSGTLLFNRRWSSAQQDWLDDRLAKNESAAWKIVYGHHPIFSDGFHGDEKRLNRQLLPLLLKHKVDVYLCGHDHDLQYFLRDGISFAVVGGGGKDTRNVKARRAEFAVSRNGFLELEASPSELTLTIRGIAGEKLFVRKLTKASTGTPAAHNLMQSPTPRSSPGRRAPLE